MSIPKYMILFMLGSVMLVSILISPPVHAAKTAQYADLNYDVVYVRCPRAKSPVVIPNSTRPLAENWKGVNDMFLSAINNIHQMPGCDLVLHHSAPSYNGNLPAGDPGREEVLVDCDEEAVGVSICTIADPNVSFDGSKIIYSKFTDTRNYIDDIWHGKAGVGSAIHKQTWMQLDKDAGEANGYRYARMRAASYSDLYPYDKPALIYEYDLSTGIETRISPEEVFLYGRAHPYPYPPASWTQQMPVMDTGPFYLPDGRIGFTSNRADGFVKFQMFTMDADGKNLEFIGHRGMLHQLHPMTLQDGRVVYTSFDAIMNGGKNNDFSLFSINPDGSDPFIFAGENDAAKFSYHYVTQLSDGDIVSTLYYNRNNAGFGTLLRFPVDPPGADFVNLRGSLNNATLFNPDGSWTMGNAMLPFSRTGQFALTPESHNGDVPMLPYANEADFWMHPSRTAAGQTLVTGGASYSVDKALVTMLGKFSHPSGAPDNDLLVTYSIGGSATVDSAVYIGSSSTMEVTLERIGKDAGLWLVPLEANSTKQVGHIVDSAQIIVDQPQYHEIMARAVVPYSSIHGMATPVQRPTTANDGLTDARLKAGQPFGLTGAASMIDRETAALNGTPWNRNPSGAMAGSSYLNLGAQGADLAIYSDDEIWGIRVSMVVEPVPFHVGTGWEEWMGYQNHHLRILGEYPVRKPVGTPVDGNGDPDTSFIVRIPADTPFFFQAIDDKGMALNMETTARTVARGEKQLCGGCHVHTRDAQDASLSNAVQDINFLGDFSGVDAAGNFTGDSALLVASDGTIKPANVIYEAALAPGVDKRRSFAVDWVNGVSQVIQARCASCHGEGQSAQLATGLRLDGNIRTYDLLTKNRYTREDGMKINPTTSEDDKIIARGGCCTDSRWLSFNSARSSMLVWALYGERMDGRVPETGLPPLPAPAPAPRGTGLLVDDRGLEHPETWLTVGSHLAHVAGMTEAEKRLIARWIDIGAPKQNVHDDLIRPVLTVTPVDNGGNVSVVQVGLWDDSALNYGTFKVTKIEGGNPVDITPTVTGSPSMIEVPLGITVNAANQESVEFTFEIADQPDRTWSVISPGGSAFNKTRKVFNGKALLRMVNNVPNSSPSSVTVSISTKINQASVATVAVVVDPDVGDSHIITVLSQPTNGSASVVNNKLVYTPNLNYTGTDTFTIRATDLGGLSVDGTASVTVTLVSNAAPTAVSATITTEANTTSVATSAVVSDPDAGDTHMISIQVQPANGSASVVSNQLVYVPDAGFTGSDSFTIRATDQDGAFVDGMASVTVTAAGSNPPPGGSSGGGGQLGVVTLVLLLIMRLSQLMTNKILFIRLS